MANAKSIKRILREKILANLVDLNQLGEGVEVTGGIDANPIIVVRVPGRHGRGPQYFQIIVKERL